MIIMDSYTVIRLTSSLVKGGQPPITVSMYQSYHKFYFSTINEQTERSAFYVSFLQAIYQANYNFLFSLP